MWHNDFMLTVAIARELTLDAAQSARSSRGTGDLRSLPPQQIKKLLDSRHDREVLEGLRKVISVCLPDFPAHSHQFDMKWSSGPQNRDDESSNKTRR